VLPFYNLDGSDETRIFSEGLVDDVITRLSRVPGLLVSSRGDAFTLEPNSASQRVRERLRVARYVEGSVQIKGEHMRIIVQLIDSETGFHILSRSFDRGREDFFDIRDEITELTVANVRVALPSETQAATSISTDNPSLDVYLLFRRGVETSRLPMTRQTIDQALAFFDEALLIDPDYAAAHAGKCSVFADGYPTTDDASFITKAETACARSLMLNPNLDVVHTALGQLYQATGRYDEAESAHLAALQINPKSVSSLTGLGAIYMLQKRASEAEERFTQAVGLYPGDWNAYAALGLFYFRSGRYLEAAAQYEIVVALDRKNATGFSNLGAAYMMAGDFSLAAPAFTSAIEIEPRPTTYSNLGLMYYYLGQLNASIDAHSRSVGLAQNDHLGWSNLGDALWISGRKEEALEAFDTARSLASSALQVNPNDPLYLMDTAWILTMLGEQAEAGSLIEQAQSLAPDDPYVHYIRALMLMRSGNREETLAVLQIAADKGYPRQMIAADPYLGPLRDSPEFRRIAEPGKPR
jgi:tetratricopeptide (TPR) repeat protein